MRSSILALALTISTGTAIPAQDVGITEVAVPAPHHNHDMQIAVTFPATGHKQALFAENAVFYGTPVLTDAQPVTGQHPVVLLSHGWGSNYERTAWLAAGLASKGAIVVAVNHPGSTTFDVDFDTAFNHWTRAEDLSTALDYVLMDPTFAPLIDENRIYATGFSYGGWTALSLAGVQGSRDGFFDYCNVAGAGSQFCVELISEGVDTTAIDKDMYEASYKDPRVRSVAAIDPGLTWDLSPDDVKNLTAPLRLIALGDEADRLEATNTGARGSNFEALVPQATVTTIAPATHFSALGLCKLGGEALLALEKDDPVCTDPAGTDRSRVLKGIIDALAQHFELE